MFNNYLKQRVDSNKNYNRRYERREIEYKVILSNTYMFMGINFQKLL